MKTTRLLSTVLLCLLALTACVDDDIKENYVFGSIVYSVEAATDGVSKRTIEIEPLEFRNPTDQEQTVNVDPYPDDFRYITLQSDDPLAFGWKDSEEVLIAQPVIDGSEVGELSNEECKVPYRKGENQYDSHYIDPREYTIPPAHTALCRRKCHLPANAGDLHPDAERRTDGRGKDGERNAGVRCALRKWYIYGVGRAGVGLATDRSLRNGSALHDFLFFSRFPLLFIPLCLIFVFECLSL